MVLKTETARGKEIHQRQCMTLHSYHNPSLCRHSQSHSAFTPNIQKPVHTLSASPTLRKAKVTGFLGIAKTEFEFLSSFILIPRYTSSSLPKRYNENWLEGHCNSCTEKSQGHSSLIHNGKEQNVVSL